MRRYLLVATALLGLVFAAACGSDEPGKPGPKDPPEKEKDGVPRCAIDLAEIAGDGGSGSNASVRKIDGGADLFGGLAASGKTGDYILENHRIRIIVQGAVDDLGPSPFGGNIIDADVIRPGGEGRDILGKVAPLFNFGRTIRPDREADLFILNDGADGKAAVLAVNVKDTPITGVDVAGAVNAGLPAARLSVDPSVPVPMKMTQYYILSPGAQRIRSITAFCNTSETAQVVAVGDLVVPGAVTDRYNPGAASGGWGAAEGVAAGPWVAFQGDGSAYALVPGNGAGPNLILTTDGLAISVHGSDSLLPYTKLIDAARPPPGSLAIDPGKSAFYERSLVVGTAISETIETVFTMSGEELGRLSGNVSGGFGDGGGVGARVLVRSGDKAVTIFDADGDGRFDSLLPVGKYRVSAALPGLISPVVEVDISAEVTAEVELVLPEAGRLELKLVEFDPREGDPQPVPGRLVARCRGATCDDWPSRADEQLYRAMEPIPEKLGVVWIGLATGEGELSRDLPPGDYDWFATNGPEYEAYPGTFASNGQGVPAAIMAGQVRRGTGRIARIVDTSGWISADLNVHTADSLISHRDRVASLLAEGIEVVVAADRNTVSDLTATASRMEAQRFLSLMGGSEVATRGFAGIGAFPLAFDPSLPGAGAIDWAGEEGSILSPARLFDVARDRGAQIVQIQDPRGPKGLFRALQLDTATLTPQASAESLLVQGDGPLFSTGFDALEIMSGGGSKSFQAAANDWITLLGQGVVVTGTASSGSRGKLVPTVGAPRSWVYMGKDKDDPTKLDQAAFVQAIKDRKVVAGYGPFLSVVAKSGGATAGVGETLSSGGGTVTLDVVAQSPLWLKYNRLEVYSYRAGTEASGGEPNSTWPKDAVATQADGTPARKSLNLYWTDYEVDAGFIDDQGEAIIRFRNEVRQSFTFQPTADTFYIVVARTVTTPAEGLENSEPAPAELAPVIFGVEEGLRPMSFTNPIFVDVDGGGYDNFPALR